MIRHFVAVRFKADVSDEARTAHMQALAGLSAHIDGILDFQSRKNVSIEHPLVRGFLDVFWFDFRDLDVRNVYLEDATHQAVGAAMVEDLEGGADGVFVFDFDA